ncbi:uncharacterized protein LOC132725208 [Ruditapes philippinarum]|uniref:uncharacterized protein LOC132725208 n=1 Tax=Ruditapes philippinarum TaxID=129788 RepID=UPI00295BC438|nr:uncharacterized protein LOC132725208 [Ruditapes philippinarum]
MKTWIIIALVLSTCVVQVDGGFLKKVFKNVGKVAGSIVTPLLGIDKLEKQAELGIHSVESGITTFNGKLANKLRNLETYLKNELILEVKKLADSGTEMTRSAQDISNSTQEVVDGVINNLIPETVETMETAQDMMKTVSDNVNKVGNAGVSVLDNVSEVVISEAAMQYFRWMMVKFVNSRAALPVLVLVLQYVLL